MSNMPASSQAAGLRQRSCKKVACMTKLPAGELSSNCCEESCLVEIARHECESQCIPDAERELRPHASVKGKDGTPSSRSIVQPCPRHYESIRDRYGAILDNMGCICKVLLSLGMESCCVIPSQASIRSKRSTAAQSVEASEDGSGAQTRTEEGRFEKSCCGSVKALVTTEAVPVVRPSDIESRSQKSCCGRDSLNMISDRFPSERTHDCLKRRCCGNRKPAAELLVNNADDCHSGTQHERKTTRADVDCSEKACCTSGASTSPCSPSLNKHFKSAQALFDSKGTAILAATASVSEMENRDIENGLFEVEHLVLSVQGMTCTGCEKKLYRLLESLPAVSNVKTSLTLAQAEFDMTGTSMNSANIIETIERMTGFICTRKTGAGEELDLIVDGNAQDFSLRELPSGVTNLSILNKNIIRVTYHPKIVGARDLIASSFFRSAKLAPVVASPLVASGRAHVRHSLFMTLLSALLTTPVLILAWGRLEGHETLRETISLSLASIVQIFVAGPFYIDAFKALFFSRMIEMDLLIVISTTAAYVYSVIAYAYQIDGRPLMSEEFFQTSTLLVTLIMLGRTISAFARQRAVESISIESLQTPTALLIDPKTHQEQEIDARLLHYQDTFKVLPDMAVVTDGIVVAGTTEIDESMITGEARMVAKKPGATVVAGSINHSGIVTVRVTRLPSENTIKTIGIMVDEAKFSKPRIQEIADRVASYFIPVIIGITILVFVVWMAIGRAVRHQSVSTMSVVAMTYAIATLIVSCPCAMGLAVPMVVAIAGGVAAKHGLIFKSAQTIEIARNISHVIFDKTGTLTQGELSVAAQEYPTEASDRLAPLILGLTANSKHPVSTAIATYMKTLQIQPSKVENFVSLPGNGIEARWNGNAVQAGNPYWLGFEDSPMVHRITSLGLTTFCVSLDGELVAVFGLSDLLRPDAADTINQLQKRSIEVSIISGDNEEAVQSVARQLGIPQSHVRSRCGPSDKQSYVKEMLASKNSVVMFCGDGTNDAIALAQASIGIHMNEGTDIAQSAADVILVRPSLTGILALIDLSKAFYQRVVFNFAWSFVYNVFAILLASGAFPHARISPQYAGLGEVASVLPVIAIAMQLKWANFRRRE